MEHVKKVEQDELADGVRRVRNQVTYDDGMSEEQWLQVGFASLLLCLRRAESPLTLLTDDGRRRRRPHRPSSTHPRRPSQEAHDRPSRRQ